MISSRRKERERPNDKDTPIYGSPEVEDEDKKLRSRAKNDSNRNNDSVLCLLPIHYSNEVLAMQFNEATQATVGREAPDAKRMANPS